MRPTARRPAALLLALLVGCHGGSGSGTPQGQVQVEFGSFTATNGRILTFGSGEATFAADATFDGEWRPATGAVTEGSWATVTTRSLVTIVPPGLPAGSYDVVLFLGPQVGHAHVQVDAAPSVADPAAAVQAWADQVPVTLVELHIEADSLPPSPARDAVLADLDYFESWRVSFTEALASATADDLRILANLLDSPLPDLAAQDTLDLGANWDLFVQRVHLYTPTFAYGISLIAAGLLVGISPPIATGLVLAGGLFVLRGVLGVLGALQTPVSPIGDVVVDDGFDQAILMVQAGLPHAVAVTANFGTVSEADRSLDYAPVQQAFAMIDAARAQQAGLTAVVRALFHAEYPPVPAVATVQRLAIPVDRVSLVSQSNPNAHVTLSGGEVLASLVGLSNQLTTLGLHYEAGTFGHLDTSLQCWVFGSGPPSPFVGSWSGSYIGTCDCSAAEGGGPVGGAWSFFIAESGMITGSVGTSEGVYQIIGGVDVDGHVAVGGIAGPASWGGVISGSAISGSWSDTSDPSCPCEGTFTGGGP